MAAVAACASAGSVQPEKGSSSPRPIGAPVAAVDDSHILYSSVPAGWRTQQIYRMEVDGTDPVQLTFDGTVEHTWPRPSPDGSKVLFYRSAPGSSVTDVDTNNLWVMDRDGSNQRLLVADGANGWTRQGHVEWSPDGTQLVMSAGGELKMDLVITAPDGSDPKVVTPRNVLTAIDPSWTNDGSGVLFIGCPTANITCWWWEFEVFRLDLGTGSAERLTIDTFADFDPYMSPDGSTIVWLRCTGTFPVGPWSIFKGSTSRVPMSATPVVDDGNVNSSVDFSADGRTLLFSRHVIGLTTWQSAATVGVDGVGLGFIGGRPAPSGRGTPVFTP